MIKPSKIIRSKRKSIAIVMKSDGTFIVRAPYFASDKEVMKFVESKQDWIKSKRIMFDVFDQKYKAVTMHTGEEIVFLGNRYILDICETDKIQIQEEKLLIPKKNHSKEVLIDWFKLQANDIFRERVNRFAKIMEVEPTAVKVSSAKTHWGSCSAKNSINLSWRLLMCPISVIYYVVVHELSHILYKNHGKQFWENVRRVMPEYKTEEEWLKAHSKLMYLF